MTDLLWLSAREQATLLTRREVSSEELVTGYLARINELNPRLGAYVTVCDDLALQEARHADARRARGDCEAAPFLGVPYSVKDIAETAGVRTTFSTKSHASYTPLADDAVIRRCKEAGFILLGKTNLPEYANLAVTESELNGVCRNPWDETLTPGGSSGGAAAALAAGLCPIAHGTDGGGSIRTPASCCGLVGLKPSRGCVSQAPRFGEHMLGNSTHGPISRTVEDSAAMLDVMRGYEAGDPYWAAPPKRPFADETHNDPGILRIAFSTFNPLGIPMQPACVAGVHQTAHLLESLGHQVSEDHPPVNLDSYKAFETLWSTSICYYNVSDSSLLEPIAALALQRANDTSANEYVQAVSTLYRCARQIVKFWKQYDIFLTSTLLRPPVPIGFMFEGSDDPADHWSRDSLFVHYFTPLANLTGQPAVSLPLYWTERGMPIGVHMIGPPAGDSILICLAAQLESVAPWRHHRPTP